MFHCDDYTIISVAFQIAMPLLFALGFQLSFFPISPFYNKNDSAINIFFLFASALYQKTLSSSVINSNSSSTHEHTWIIRTESFAELQKIFASSLLYSV